MIMKIYEIMTGNDAEGAKSKVLLTIDSKATRRMMQVLRF